MHLVHTFDIGQHGFGFADVFLAQTGSLPLDSHHPQIMLAPSLLLGHHQYVHVAGHVVYSCTRQAPSLMPPPVVIPPPKPKPHQNHGYPAPASTQPSCSQQSSISTNHQSLSSGIPLHTFLAQHHTALITHAHPSATQHNPYSPQIQV